MQFIQKAVRALLLTILIMLAVFGVGITGAAPLELMRRRRSNEQQFEVELIDEKEADSLDTTKAVFKG